MGLLEGKRALITGGTTGLGLAVAGRFQAEGARVVITGRDAGLGERAGQALGPDARFLAADAADPEAIASSVRAADHGAGQVDVAEPGAGQVDQVEPGAGQVLAGEVSHLASLPGA